MENPSDILVNNLEDQILVKSCPLCEIFQKPKIGIKTKLYWPEKIENIPKSEFVIVNCLSCKVPMVVYGEHLTSITNEAWGRILYICRKKFGRNITLRHKPRTIRDHYHCHIYNIDKK